MELGLWPLGLWAVVPKKLKVLLGNLDIYHNSSSFKGTTKNGRL